MARLGFSCRCKSCAQISFEPSWHVFSVMGVSSCHSAVQNYLWSFEKNRPKNGCHDETASEENTAVRDFVFDDQLTHTFQAHSVCFSHPALPLSSEVFEKSESFVALEARPFLWMDIKNSKFCSHQTMSHFSPVSFSEDDSCSHTQIVVLFCLQVASSSSIFCFVNSTIQAFCFHKRSQTLEAPPSETSVSDCILRPSNHDSKV